jgi:hypothetical protein
MKISLKVVLKWLLPQKAQTFLKKQLWKIQFKEWERSGCPVPPPHLVKQMTIAEYQRKYGLTTFIETGTFTGDMVEAQKKRFKKIISIELSDELYRKACRRFRKDKNVVIVKGDSGNVLPVILKGINEPAIFWLDGHYSEGFTAKGEKNCPIFEELEAIFNGNSINNVLLIDDARCFIGKDDFPEIDELKDFVRKRNPKYKAEIKHDIICFTI